MAPGQRPVRNGRNRVDAGTHSRRSGSGDMGSLLSPIPNSEPPCGRAGGGSRSGPAVFGASMRGRLILDFARAAASAPGWPAQAESLPGGGPYVSAAFRLARAGRGVVPVDVTIARGNRSLLGLPAAERTKARRERARGGAAHGHAIPARSSTPGWTWLLSSAHLLNLVAPSALFDTGACTGSRRHTRQTRRSGTSGSGSLSIGVTGAPAG